MIDGLPPFCPVGTPLTVSAPPAGTATVLARHADGTVRELPNGTGYLTPGTWAVEARAADGGLLAEDLVTVAAHPGAGPVPGFVSGYDAASLPRTLEWLRALRCTVVQAYDWMVSYAEPLPAGAGERWADPLGRPVERAAITGLASELAAGDAVLQAYAPVYAADPVGAGNYVTSCDLGIFMDQAAEPVPAQNPDACARSRRKRRPGRRVLLQRPVRPVSVVMTGILAEDQPQVPLAGDQVQLAEPAAGQDPGQRGQHRPAGPRQPRGLDLTLQHGDLIAQDQDLRVLGTVGPGKHGKPAEHPQHRQVGESH